MNTFLRTFAYTVVALTVSHELRAEDGCPPGQVPQQGNGWNACIPVAGHSASVHPPKSVWESRWQAVAVDVHTGAVGTVVDRPDKRTAEKEALIECSNKGGASCEIEISAGNQCVSLVVGRSLLATGAGMTKSAAELQAIGECEAVGVTCKPFYSACSLPVRIQ